jgi:hypothetical protein
MYVTCPERQSQLSGFWPLTFSNFVTSRQCVYGKLEKQPLQPFWDGFRRLLACHLFSTSEMSALLFHVIVADVEHQMLL